MAKSILLLGEKASCTYANEIITVSKNIQKHIKEKFGRDSSYIPNGVKISYKTTSTSYLNALDIESEKYILSVSRFVPEKGLHDLIEAFTKISGNQQLVIAGDADHETKYSRELKKKAAADSRIILTGYITGEYLRQVFSHARLFVLPSYHEGLPIALLEAMSYNLPPLVSDIPAHQEIKLSDYCYFRCGDVEHLRERLEQVLSNSPEKQEEIDYCATVAEKYNWDKIARQTIAVYEKVLRK